MSFQFRFGRPQKIAALILLFFFAETLFVIGREHLTDADYRYALCGREMWEGTAPVTGYFTTCGNMQGDGSLAYRAAALPVSIYVAVLRVEDWAAAKRPGHSDEANPVTGSLYDLRHQIVGIRYLVRVPFALAAVMLGGSLWWVTRRLFGNIGGVLALGLYTVSPPVLHFATSPNNEILAAWGLFAVIYTAIGIGHAMYGPPRKWKPRILLYTVALGLTACAHLLAAGFGLIASALFLLYVVTRRRTVVFPLLLVSSFGAAIIVLASYNFHIGLFLYAFTAGAARFIPSIDPAMQWFQQPQILAALAAAAISLVLYITTRRSRYFGNTAPLLTTLALLPIQTTQVNTLPTLWAYPFLLTFIAGVFADATETSQRKMYIAIVITTLVAQVVLCGVYLAGGFA
jgi:hypothetical protein